MEIEKSNKLTEDISSYYDDMDPEMYFDKKDIDEFTDIVIEEVGEKTGKDDLRLFSFYLSDGDKLKVVLEDKKGVFPVEIKIDPLTARRRRGLFRYIDVAVNQLVDVINQYSDLFEAHYGGAYDILDDQYFTKDDLTELMYYIEDELNEDLVNDRVSIVDGDITGKELNLELVSDQDGFYEEYHRKIDMRRIKIPSDLIKVYGTDAVRVFREKLESDGLEFKI